MKITHSPATRLSGLSTHFFANASLLIDHYEQTHHQPVINLGIGSPDLAPPEAVVTELVNQAQRSDNHGYPTHQGLPALREAISRRYQRKYNTTLDPKTQVLPLAGSKEGVTFLTLSLINPGDEVLIPNPGYVTYTKATELAGGKAVSYTLRANNYYRPDLDELTGLVTTRTKLMWINYPHNPTGATIDLDTLRQLVEFAHRHQIILASDNPYNLITFQNYQAPSVLQIPKAIEVSVELNSFSKSYNMAGWRLGWLAGNHPVVQAVNKLYSQVESGIFLPIQKAGMVALETSDQWLAERNRIYESRLLLGTQLLDALHCQYQLSQATFYLWGQLPKNNPHSEQFCFDLLEKTGVFLTPGSVFGSAGEGHLRIALCQSEQILKEAISRIKVATNQ